MDHEEIARQFFAAAEAGDTKGLAEVCSVDMTARQNNAPAMGLPDLQKFTLAVKRAIPDFHYENGICSGTESGFVEEHDIVGTLPDGNRLFMRLCVVANIVDGQIVSMHEYADSYGARGLIKAVSEGG
jgi:ketosteroid isomerase-like protein